MDVGREIVWLRLGQVADFGLDDIDRFAVGASSSTRSIGQGRSVAAVGALG